MKKLLHALLLLITFSSFSQTPPNAQFVGNPTTVCQGQSIQFSNQSTPGSSPITTYSWDFGDGNSATTQNASHVYSVPGTYTVTLTVQAANGQADFELKSNYVTVNPKPTSGFSMSTNGCTLPVGVTFNNTSSGASSYSWSFGNGQTSTNQSPGTQNYTSAGTYNVSLITTNSFGCKDTLLQPIVVSDFQAGINVPSTVCQNSPVTISDNSTVGANSWNWTFTGGSPGSSTSSSTAVTYSTPGTYTIQLTAQNTSLGCSASTSAQITVLPTPTPSFSANPATGCAPLAVTFTNTSPSGSNFQWDFGDGSTFTGQNPPAHTYTNNGSYTVTLTMTGSNGCTGSTSLNAVNLTPPVAGFTSDVQQGCDPLNVQFIDTSSTSDPITAWTWTFGDGTTFTGQNPPVHTYPVGVYDVSLTITTASGCQGSVSMPGYIQVGHIDLVNFSIDQTPECAKRSIDFTNNSVILAPHTSSEVTYFWDFGDGGTSTQENPSYSYSSDTGYFDVTLIVDFRGCKDTLIITDAVYIKAPISLFSPAQTLYCNPSSFPVTVPVNDNSKIGQIPDDCLMIWKWGDGTTTTFDDPDFDDADLGSTSHDYTSYGTYTIEQVIYNYTTGCADSTTQTVYISQTIANIGPLTNDSVCVNSTFGLTDASTSTHPFGTYSWDMGDGNTISGATPSYAYSSFGTYTITLTATNSVGCADNATFAPMTALALPLAQLSASDIAGCSPFLVTFTNGSSVQNNGVPLSSFLFSFPDDGTTQTTTSVATTVNHTFNTEGVFPVSLVATDQFGCVSAPASINITLTKPVAAFTVDSVVCNQQNVSTVNTSTGVNPLSYQWSVDNTVVGTNQEYATSYNENSNQSSHSHDYELIVTDANGCKDTLHHTLIVSTPIADLSYTFSGAATNANGDYLCPPVFGSYTNNSDSYGSISAYAWNFGDSKTSILEDPNNTYVFPGTYTLSFQITDEFGCVDDTVLTDYLTIFGPVANPSWTQDLNGCGQDVTFDIGTTSNLTSIVWNTGDNQETYDSLTFTHTYQDVSTYQPTLTVTDSNNCQVVYPMNPVTIPDIGLNAYFEYMPTDPDLGGAVIFDDQSTSITSISSWAWDLGTSSIVNNSGANVTMNYFVPGSYTITLVVTDINGCTDTYSLDIFVKGDFNMPNIITPNGDGTNELFSFPYDIFESFDILIANRWGNIMKDGRNQTGTIFWDGTNLQGDPCSEGVYFYKFKGTLKDGSAIEKSGFLEVIR